MKIRYHMAQLEAKVGWHFFSGHTVKMMHMHKLCTILKVNKPNIQLNDTIIHGETLIGVTGCPKSTSLHTL